VSDALLIVLRLCLLALLYLFFMRVVRAVWVEVRTPAPAVGAINTRKERRARTEKPPRKERRSAKATPHLALTEPREARGRIYDLGGTEVSIGRAAGCTVTVDDTFVSQLHARVYTRDGQIMVEDMGSTNGTYLNRRRVSSPMVMQPGDQLQVGNTVMELR
jgi:pSer/pThr/pTyr-binding forkhead associated (FHA) protein